MGSSEEEAGIIDVGSPPFEYRFGSLEERIGDWGSETGTEWDWGTKGRRSSPSPSSLSRETEAAIVRMRYERNLGSAKPMPQGSQIYPHPAHMLELEHKITLTPN